jgi:chromosome segregation ATPase|tara:strand:+ start:2830 stop:3246 length:417 start_codon:yes stop_codon:yes gene_type:complete
MSDKDIIELKIATELLKKDAEKCESLFDRTQLTLDKIQETNQNIVKMISLHEQRLDQQEKLSDGLHDDIRDIHTKIDQIEDRITDKLDEIKNDLIKHKKDDRNPFVKWADIDKAKYFLIGFVLALGFLLGELEIFDLF